MSMANFVLIKLNNLFTAILLDLQVKKLSLFSAVIVANQH